jgi:ribosomal protein S12 methylthiotransferase accessory factor
MENLETAIAEQFAPQDMVRASFRTVAPDFLPTELSLGFPSALTRDTELDWCPARGVLDGANALVPYLVVSLWQATTRSWFPVLFARASNGLASGNSLAEAGLHALWELVERDCVARFSAVPLDERRYIEPGSVTDPLCRWLISRMQGDGFHLEIVDASFGVWPTFAVYLYSDDMADVFGGAGAHGDAAVALTRALTEAAQSRVSVISGLRDDIPDDTYRVRRRHVELVRSPRTTLDTWSSVVHEHSRRFDRSAGAAGQLRQLAASVANHTGHQPLLVDLSPKHAGFSVCRMIAPRLRHVSRTKFSRVGGTVRNV